MKCHRCGNKATEKLPDPYMMELYPEDPESSAEYWWCDDCYNDRAEDI